MRRLLPLCFAILVLVTPAVVFAQDGFFFQQPRVTVSLQIGPTLPKARGGVFDLFTSELTLDRKDFAAPSIGGEVSIRTAPRFDVVMNAFHSKSSQRSEFRRWVDNNDQPIEQVTEFTRTPVTVSARYYPTERGRAVGRYAWVPRPLLPYVGAGAGVVWYKLMQDGDFVDHATLDIFSDHLLSKGAAGTAHVFVGAQWWAMGRFGFTTEARYSVGSAPLKDGFAEFDSINLNGFQWTVGLSNRF